MPVVKCVTMQRDEWELLDPWLRYHGFLFGFDNLTVIDNGSVRPDVLAVLDRAEAAGVTVYRQFATKEDYADKGKITTEVIQALDNASAYDFVLPLDCDEFFALWTACGLTTDRTAIHHALEALDPASTHFRIGDCVFNDAGRPGWFFASPALKGFLRAGTVDSLDHGSHTFSRRPEFPMAGCRFTHFHFHYKTHQAVRLHTRWKLAPFVDVEDEVALRGFTGAGHHLLHNYFASEQEYGRQFEDRLTFHCDELARLLGVLGVTAPLLQAPPLGRTVPGGMLPLRLPCLEGEAGRMTDFSPARYRHLNLDIAADGVDPIRHYLLSGFRENRQF